MLATYRVILIEPHLHHAGGQGGGGWIGLASFPVVV